MAKVPTYTLAWSSTMETYELYQTRDREGLRIVPDSPAWFAWLDQVSSFAFSGKSGHFTARKEAKQRGDRYWYAYLATGRQLTKKYLGKTINLTLARLEHIASEMSATQAASRQHRQTVPMQRAQNEPQWQTPINPLLTRPSCMYRAHGRNWSPALTSSSNSSEGWSVRSRSSPPPPGSAKQRCWPSGLLRAVCPPPGSHSKRRTTTLPAFSPT